MRCIRSGRVTATRRGCRPQGDAQHGVSRTAKLPPPQPPWGGGSNCLTPGSCKPSVRKRPGNRRRSMRLRVRRSGRSRGALRASGRNGPLQLRIRAGDSACVLTRCIGALEVWLCLRRVTTRARQFERFHQVLLGSGTIDGEPRRGRGVSD